MELQQISAIFHLSAAIVLGIIIILRMEFNAWFKKREIILRMARSWRYLRYFSYLVLTFFVLCALTIGVMLADMVMGITIVGLGEILNVILGLLLLLIGVDMLVMISIMRWGDDL